MLENNESEIVVRETKGIERGLKGDAGRVGILKIFLSPVLFL